jgi:WD40 repeat protein
LFFSPDGQFLYHRCAPDGRFKVYRLDGAAAEVLLEAEGGYLVTPAFSWDGRFLALGHYNDGSVAVHDLQSAHPDKPEHSLPTGPRPWQLAFRPGTAHLAVSDRAVAGGNVVRVFDGEGGKPLFPDLMHPAGTTVDWIAWHPDGRTLATTCSDGQVRLWDVASGKLRLPPLAGRHGDGAVVAFNPAGDCLLSNDWGGSLRLWDPRSGRQLLHTGGTAGAFSRDGGLLAPDIDPSGQRLRPLRVETRRPLRALAAPGNAAWRRLRAARVSPDGRLLLVARSDALALVDWAGGAELNAIPLPQPWVVGFDPDGSPLTSGRAGVLRWPVRDEAATGRLHVGPPESLYGDRVSHLPSCSADGRVLAITGFPMGSATGALVLHRPENRRVSLGPREDIRHCAVSPDGRWVATGNHTNLGGIGATVWDAQTGREEHNFPVGGLCSVGFSPDGKWLLTNGGGVRLWKVGTWEEGPRPAQAGAGGDAGFAFAPDGRVLALSGGLSQVWLVDVDSGAEIARLTVPEQTGVAPQCFSPDGSQLVAIGYESELVYIWDLRALRAQLKELDLDWDQPDYPEAVPPAPAPREVRVAAIDDSADPQRLNDEAWRLVTGPADQRDPARALQLIQQAVKQKPAETMYLNTLGVVHYRSGQYKEAVAALEKSLAAGKGRYDAFDLFFLAMCHAKLGDPAKAKDCFDRAVKWVEAQKNLPAQHVEELKAFRAEAAETLRPAP